jgi:hypothetical protein
MRAFIHRNRWLLLAGCFLFFGARWLFLQGKPERLRDLSLSGAIPAFVRGERGYFLNSELGEPHPKCRFRDSQQFNITSSNYMTIQGAKSFSLNALPIYGGRDRTISQRSHPETVFHRTQITGDSVIVLAFPVNETLPLKWERWELLLSGKKYKTTEVLFYSRAALHAFPLTGGAPVDILPDRQFTVATATKESVYVTRDRVYWIEIDPNKKPVEGCASLKMIARSGGEPQTLMSDLSPFTSLRKDGGDTERVWMFVPTGTDRSSDLKVYHVGGAESQPQLFQKSAKSWSTFYPATLQERVYWKSMVLLPGQTSTYAEEIYSARWDGSDSSKIDSVICSRATFLSWMSMFYVHQGALYTPRYVSEKPRPGQSDLALVRVEPGVRGKAAEVFRFPAGVGQPLFDGENVYYTLDEKHENFWDWSQEGLQPDLKRTLCRYRLPD